MMQSQTPLDSPTAASKSLDASDQPLHHQDHAPSSPARAPYAEISAPGIQPSHTVQAEKEAAYTTDKETVDVPAEKEFVPSTDGDKEVFVYPLDAKELPADRDKSPSPNPKNRVCGISRRWWLAIVAAAVCLIVLAIALGVVLGRKHSRAGPGPGPNPNITIGGALNPKYYSTQGAFNGSGISLASANFGVDSTILVYYQDYTGDIKVSVLDPDGSWSAASSTLTSDARNGTPISTVAFVADEAATWHAFYLDRNSYVRELINTNASSLEDNFWQNGPLNELNLKANDADRVGIQACYWAQFVGDADYAYTAPPATANSSQLHTVSGMHLWYADTDTSFQQYSWYSGANQWSNDNHTWNNLNGHAGVGCQTWDTGSTQYVFMADLDNTLSIFWKDSNSSNETPSHPINTWVNTSISIPNLHPSTSISYTNYITLQAADNTIRGYNVSWGAENTSLAPAPGGAAGYDEYIVHTLNGSDVYALSGTQLTCTALATLEGGADLAVYFQSSGDDMMLWTTNVAMRLGPWTPLSLPIS